MGNHKLDISTLYFTPYAFAKLIHMRDVQDKEVGGWGITAKESPLVVRDFMLCKQEVSGASVDFDDDGLVEFFDLMASKHKLEPHQFSRIWIHTHPANSARPSGTDEETFGNALSQSDYAIMAILAKGGETYARLRVSKPFEIEIEMNIAILWKAAFPQSKKDSWDKEFEDNVTEKTYHYANATGTGYGYTLNKKPGYVWDSEQQEYVHHTQTLAAQRKAGRKAKKKPPFKNTTTTK